MEMIVAGLRLDPEEISEKVVVGFDAKKSLTEMNKDGHMGNRIGIQVVKLKTINIKKAIEKIRGREGQSLFDKMLEHDDLIYILLRIRLAERRTPLDYILTMKKTLDNKINEVISRTLTI
jgi:hypothetical protein